MKNLDVRTVSKFLPNTFQMLTNALFSRPQLALARHCECILYSSRCYNLSENPKAQVALSFPNLRSEQKQVDGGKYLKPIIGLLHIMKSLLFQPQKYLCHFSVITHFLLWLQDYEIRNLRPTIILTLIRHFSSLVMKIIFSKSCDFYHVFFLVV